MEKVKIETWNDYVYAAKRTATESSMNREYISLGMMAEAGEVCGKIAKWIRDHNGEPLTKEFYTELQKEIGDVCWFLAMADYLRYINGTCVKFPAYDSFNDGIYMKCGLSTRLMVDVYDLAMAIIDVGTNIQSMSAPKRTKNINQLLVMMRFALGKGDRFEDILQMNIDKLTDRYNRGVIGGSGDNR